MGLLSRAYNAVDRYLPADGLLDPMFGGGAQPAPQGQPQGGGLLSALGHGLGTVAHVADNLLGLGIGDTIHGVRQQGRNADLKSTILPILSDQSVPIEQRIAAARQALSKAAQSGADTSQWETALQAAEEKQRTQAFANTITDPVLRQTFLMNPKAYTDAAAEQLKPQKLGQGDTLYQNGGVAYTAPKTGVDGGYGYSQTPQGISWQDQRPMSFAEILQQAQEEEAARHNRQAEATANSGVGVRWAAHNARLKAGGYGTPGVGTVIGSDLPDGWEIQDEGGQ